MMAAASVDTATDRQVSFLRRLLEQKVVRAEIRQQIETQLELGMAKRQASIFIDGLLRCDDQPVAPPLPPAPPAYPPAVSPGPRGDHWPKVQEGRYAVIDPAEGVLKFYQVDKPKEGRWEGFTFLSVFASSERHPIKAFETKKRIMDVIAKDPRAALERYGKELGVCGVCGRELTDPLSRHIGIGPICRGKLGYTPEEEKELREQIRKQTQPAVTQA